MDQVYWIKPCIFIENFRSFLLLVVVSSWRGTPAQLKFNICIIFYFLKMAKTQQKIRAYQRTGSTHLFGNRTNTRFLHLKYNCNKLNNNLKVTLFWIKFEIILTLSDTKWGNFPIRVSVICCILKKPMLIGKWLFK